MVAMRHAIALHEAGSWPRAAERATLTLAAADRHRRRVVLADDADQPFLLDLPRAVQMRDGDGLELEGGGFIRVVAAEEEVIDIRCRSDGELARLCWHIGNRHLPVQFLPERTLRVALDHVLMGRLEAQGAEARRQRSAFQPEPGAYDPHGLMETPAPLVRRA